MLDARRIPHQGAGAKRCIPRRVWVVRQTFVAAVQRQHEVGVIMDMGRHAIGRQACAPQAYLEPRHLDGARSIAQERA